MSTEYLITATISITNNVYDGQGPEALIEELRDDINQLIDFEGDTDFELAWYDDLKIVGITAKINDPEPEYDCCELCDAEDKAAFAAEQEGLPDGSDYWVIDEDGSSADGPFPTRAAAIIDGTESALNVAQDFYVLRATDRINYNPPGKATVELQTLSQ